MSKIETNSFQPLGLIVFGPQGSGKTTQAERLAEKYQLTFIDSGEILRNLALIPSELGQKIKATQTAGLLVDHAIVNQVVGEYLETHPNPWGYTFDGYPRNLTECQFLSQLARKYHWKVIAVSLNISTHTAFQRISKRVIEVNGQVQHRSDDKPEIVEKRLKIFTEQTRPVLNWFKIHYQAIEIDGEPSIDEVTQLIFQALEPLVNA
jgi:adenylate kinase